MATDKSQDIDLGIVRYEYGEQARKQRAVLQIDTGKSHNGGLASSATVFWLSNHSRQTMLGIGGGGDFGKRLYISPKLRATQKAIEAQHAAVFTADVVEALVATAKLHYAKVISAGVDGFKNTYEPQV